MAFLKDFFLLSLILNIFLHKTLTFYLKDTNSIEENSEIDLSEFGSEIYGLPDEDKTGQLVQNYNNSAEIGNPEELGSYLEGDILIPISQGRSLTRNGVTSNTLRWSKGQVPFKIEGRFNSHDLAIIHDAIEQYHKHTCIRFMPHNGERDYVSIVNGNSGCWSSVGRIGGKQEVNLQTPGCLTKPGTAIHELMHALGFLHEQNRAERDDFVTINYSNIQPSARSNFDKASNTNAYGVKYDYGSVMHYSANAFSVNGRPTIIAKYSEGNSKMGQRDGFSIRDIEKLNKMYNCGKNGNTSVKPGTGGNSNVVNSFLGGLISGLGG